VDRSVSSKDRIREFVQRYAQERGVSTVGDGESLIQNGVVDSLGIFKLVAFLEETFSIRIPDEEIVFENLESVDRIESFVNAKLRR
jgi:acyl carrier protein